MAAGGGATRTRTNHASGTDEVVDRGPLRTLVSAWPWAWAFVGVLVGLRLVAVAGLRFYVYFDSPEYDTIDFTGRSRRPWATPLLFWLVPGDEHRVVVAQAVIGALCWAVLALSAAAWFRLPATRIAVAATLGALGCTTALTNWDAAKLSESLALSLTVLVIGAWLNLVRRPTPLTAGLLLLATLPWLFTRQSLMPSAWMLAAVAGTGAVVTWRRRGATRVFATVAVGLLVLVGVASASYGRNQEIVRENLTVIVANRIATDPGRLAWFKDHGMPVPASGALDYTSLKGDASFVHWVAGDGRQTYVRFLVSHPWYSLTEPLDDLVGTRRSYGDEVVPQTTMLSPGDAYASSRPVEPEVLEQVLFQPGGTGTVLTALGAVVIWTAVRRRRRHAGWVVPTVLIVISLASLVAGWHGATPELARLAILGSVGLRIGIIIQLAVLAEGELLARRSLAQLEGPPQRS
ncbi:MAG: hypothetical protein JWM47_453 [Acidimicrobiales bacterium]|nr:hypothetical protein [Acidimicrobiales bacterium]